jgi:hypothetical protein
LPAISAFVANFRWHAGHRNFTIAGGWFAASSTSRGAGTTNGRPHRRQSIVRPTWDNSASLGPPQAGQLQENLMTDRTSEM